jgi:uncharacterized protein HemX
MANGLLLFAVLALVAAMIVVLRQYLLLARKKSALQNQLVQLRGEHAELKRAAANFDQRFGQVTADLDLKNRQIKSHGETIRVLYSTLSLYGMRGEDQ